MLQSRIVLLTKDLSFSIHHRSLTTAIVLAVPKCIIRLCVCVCVCVRDELLHEHSLFKVSGSVILYPANALKDVRSFLLVELPPWLLQIFRNLLLLSSHPVISGVHDFFRAQGFLSFSQRPCSNFESAQVRFPVYQVIPHIWFLFRREQYDLVKGMLLLLGPCSACQFWFSGPFVSIKQPLWSCIPLTTFHLAKRGSLLPKSARFISEGQYFHWMPTSPDT